MLGGLQCRSLLGTLSGETSFFFALPCVAQHWRRTPRNYPSRSRACPATLIKLILSRVVSTRPPCYGIYGRSMPPGGGGAPPRPRAAQSSPRAAPEQPQSNPEQPRAAQSRPGAAQSTPPEQPQSSPASPLRSPPL